MLGIKYLRYYPENAFQLPSGLKLYKFWFRNADGTRGVVVGQCTVFTETESTIIYKIFERSSSFHAKSRNTGNF